MSERLRLFWMPVKRGVRSREKPRRETSLPATHPPAMLDPWCTGRAPSHDLTRKRFAGFRSICFQAQGRRKERSPNLPLSPAGRLWPRPQHPPGGLHLTVTGSRSPAKPPKTLPMPSTRLSSAAKAAPAPAASSSNASSPYSPKTWLLTAKSFIESFLQNVLPTVAGWL
jgi:hypothetical protein